MESEICAAGQSRVKQAREQKSAGLSTVMRCDVRHAHARPDIAAAARSPLPAHAVGMDERDSAFESMQRFRLIPPALRIPSAPPIPTRHREPARVASTPGVNKLWARPHLRLRPHVAVNRSSRPAAAARSQCQGHADCIDSGDHFEFATRSVPYRFICQQRTRRSNRKVCDHFS